MICNAAALNIIAKEFWPDIRPEFLGDVVQGGAFQLCSPVDCRLTRAALLSRVVGVGQSCFKCIAHDFGPVEALASGIGFGDHHAGKGIACAAEETSVA